MSTKLISIHSTLRIDLSPMVVPEFLQLNLITSIVLALRTLATSSRIHKPDVKLNRIESPRKPSILPNTSVQL